jgi:hypothetical protein
VLNFHNSVVWLTLTIGSRVVVVVIVAMTTLILVVARIILAIATTGVELCDNLGLLVGP